MPLALPLATALAPRTIEIIAVLGTAFAVLIVALFAARRRRRRPPLPPPPLPTGVRTKADLEVERAKAEVERAQAERAQADARAQAEQAERRQKEEAARRKADEEAKARADAEAKAKELARAAEAAATEEERRRARAEAEKLSAEAARRKKEEAEAERRAAYEAKKAQEAEQKARRRAEEETKRLEELQAAQRRAEEAAREELERQRRIEAESGRTLADGLSKTRGGFIARLAQLVGAAPAIDDRFLGELEEILFTADIGVRTADRLMGLVREKLKKRELSHPDKVKAALREEIERILSLDGVFAEGGMPASDAKPQVLMIVGVNGSGKTTTIGKLAFKARAGGGNVLLGAGDTFRAAAAEQLDVWATRAEVDIVKGVADQDPASVCFEAVKKGVEEGRDLVLLDTAGRLHTKVSLMDELKKVKRVIDKAMPGAPHSVWLVVDGTTGQNGLEQAKQFHEALGLNGLVLTKLDGTAKGGIVIGICDQLKVPVRYVGVGEKIGDLKPFRPKEFVDALFQEG